MNIAIFTNNYLPNPYGVTGSIESFRSEFEKRGHKVYIFAPYYKEYKDNNPNIFRYPSLDIEIKIKFPLAVPYSWKINKIIKKLDLDIIHSQHPNLLGTAAMKWARRLNIPLVFTWHTLYDKYTNFVPFLPKKFAADYIMKKAVKYANRANAVIAPTDSIIPILKKWGVHPHTKINNKKSRNFFKFFKTKEDDFGAGVNKNIFSIPTGIEEKNFADPDGNIVRKKYNIADDEIVLLLVSRLTSEKNIGFVFQAVKSVLKDKKINPVKYFSFTKNNFAKQNLLSRVKFLVCGEGYLLPELRKFCEEDSKISEKVIFAGLVSKKDLKNYYAAGDIFVYGSKSETQGMIISEAMYCGLPIVAVNATGTSSLALNNGNGFLVNENREKFAEAIEKLINDKDLRQKFGESSKKIAQAKFTSSVCAERMLEVYKNVIEIACG